MGSQMGVMDIYQSLASYLDVKVPFGVADTKSLPQKALRPVVMHRVYFTLVRLEPLVVFSYVGSPNTRRHD